MARYTLETERLLLRQWREQDRDAWIEIATEPEFYHYALRRALSRDEASDRFDHIRELWRTFGFGHYAVELKDGGALVGYVGLTVPTFLPVVLPSVEIGWRLGKRYWGNGYATEAARACIEFGFNDLLLNRIVCIYEPVNEASMRLAQRLGFREYMTTTHPALGLDLRVAELSRTRGLPPS